MVTAVWGYTFVLVKDAIAQYPTLPFLGLRFALALAIMAVLVHRPPGRRVLLAGLPIGLALAAGYAFQTFGLQTTSPGNAGLITGLFVVFTPLMERALGVPVGWRTYGAVAIALTGTMLLTGGAGHIGLGDLLVLGCAIAFSVHLVMLSRWSPGLPAAPLAMVQLAVAAVLFGAAGAPMLRPPSGPVWVAIAITAVFASAAAFFIQTWAQAHLSASRTALILATEPAWALFFGITLAGQHLALIQALGALLILVAILGHELLAMRPGRQDRRIRAK